MKHFQAFNSKCCYQSHGALRSRLPLRIEYPVHPAACAKFCETICSRHLSAHAAPQEWQLLKAIHAVSIVFGEKPDHAQNRSRTMTVRLRIAVDCSKRSVPRQRYE